MLCQRVEEKHELCQRVFFWLLFSSDFRSVCVGSQRAPPLTVSALGGCSFLQYEVRTIVYSIMVDTGSASGSASALMLSDNYGIGHRIGSRR